MSRLFYLMLCIFNVIGVAANVVNAWQNPDNMRIFIVLTIAHLLGAVGCLWLFLLERDQL